MRFEEVELEAVADGHLLACEMCGAVVHADKVPTHESFHTIAGGVLTAL